MSKNNEAVIEDTEEVLEKVLEEHFPTHPFENTLEQANFESLIGNYLAMSQSFPYLQAGSQKDLIFHSIENNAEIPKDVEVTSVVGNFLSWDETGGNYLLSKHGIEGLPKILETDKFFHYWLLKHDIHKILNKDVKPEYSDATKSYLVNLYNGLSSLDPVVRCAYMVSFESHAERMITQLWNLIDQTYELNKDELTYFHTHVGGDDPAEAYHVATTNGMVEKIVPKDEFDRFIEEFKKAYNSHIQWCSDIITA